MFVVGLTGGIGTGKNTVAAMLADLGAEVLDADQIVHEAMKPKGKLVPPIARMFGKEVLQDGGVDRRKLAGIVFDNPVRLRKLEKIVHPFVQQQIRAAMVRLRKSKKTQVVVLNIPLLFESKAYSWVDETVVVKTSRETQIRRACQHLKLTRAEVSQRIQRQMPLSQKIRLADIIIDNNGSLAATRAQVKAIWQRWEARGRIH